MTGFLVPNRADAAYDPQARLFSSDLAILAQGPSLTGVKTGCAVTAQGSPNMTVAVASGEIYWLNSVVSVSSGNVTITAADATNPRIDLVVVNSSGTKSASAGTPDAAPLAPDIPANSVVLAQVYVPATDTTIGADQIVDKRLFVQVPAVAGASTIVRKTADESVTSSTTLQNDNELLFTMTSNSIYQVRFYLMGQSAAGTAVRVNFSGPSGAVWRMMSVVVGGTFNLSSDGNASDMTTAGMPTTGAGSIHLEGVATSSSTSGDFTLRWAQVTSSGTALKILANSYLEYRLLT